MMHQSYWLINEQCVALVTFSPAVKGLLVGVDMVRRLCMNQNTLLVFFISSVV